MISVAMAAALHADSKDDQIKKLTEMVEKLSDRVTELESAQSSGISAEMEEELGYIDERISLVEELSFQDKIRLGLGFKTRVDNFKSEMASGNDYSDNAIFSTKAHINMDATISDNLKFSGRATMYKYWGDSTRRAPEMADISQARVPGDSGLYMERAYVDWLLGGDDVQWVLSMGRLPGTDGPSYQFMEGAPRISNYSASLIDTAIDGGILTANMDAVTGIPNTALRAVYGKPYQEDDADTMSTNYTGVKSDNQLDDYHTYGIVGEISIPGISDSLAAINFLWGKDMIASPLLGSENGNVNVGDFQMIGAFVELPNVVEGLDLFAHANYTNLKPNTGIYEKEAAAGVNYHLGLNKGSLLEQTELLAAAQMGSADAMIALQALQDDIKNDTEERDGHNFWLGMRYTMPFNLAPKIGLEWNYGSKYWWSGTSGSYHPTNKLATRGHAYEAYVLFPVNEYANVRVGYIHQDYEYTTGHLGEPIKIDDLKKSAAAQATGLADLYPETLSTMYAQMSIFF